jgi:hypothetical protein
MSDDLDYRPGDWYRICDRTGFKIRARRTRKQWNGYWVRDQSWEPRNAQDLVKGIADYQSVPEPRPRPPVRFIQQKVILIDQPLPVLSTNPTSSGYGVPLYVEPGPQGQTSGEPPTLSGSGGLIYVVGSPGPNEIPPVTQNSYPKSN